MTTLLKFDPVQQIQINSASNERASAKTIIHVTNTSSQPVAFKVKTTQPKRYFVNPTQGILDAGASDHIQIQVVPKDRALLSQGASDRFLIQAVVCEPRFTQLNRESENFAKELDALWAGLDKNAPQQLAKFIALTTIASFPSPVAEKERPPLPPPAAGADDSSSSSNEMARRGGGGEDSGRMNRQAPQEEQEVLVLQVAHVRMAPQEAQESQVPEEALVVQAAQKAQETLVVQAPQEPQEPQEEQARLAQQAQQEAQEPREAQEVLADWAQQARHEAQEAQEEQAAQARLAQRERQEQQEQQEEQARLAQQAWQEAQEAQEQEEAQARLARLAQQARQEALAQQEQEEAQAAAQARLAQQARQEAQEAQTRQEGQEVEEQQEAQAQQAAQARLAQHARLEARQARQEALVVRAAQAQLTQQARQEAQEQQEQEEAHARLVQQARQLALVVQAAQVRLAPQARQEPQEAQTLATTGSPQSTVAQAGVSMSSSDLMARHGGGKEIGRMGRKKMLLALLFCIFFTVLAALKYHSRGKITQSELAWETQKFLLEGLEEDYDGSSTEKLLLIGGGEVGPEDAGLEGEPLSDRALVSIQDAEKWRRKKRSILDAGKAFVNVLQARIKTMIKGLKKIFRRGKKTDTKAIVEGGAAPGVDKPKVKTRV